MNLTDADRTRVAAAVTEAELTTDGEIVTVIAGRSDAYHDVALHWTVLAMLLVLALLAWQPGIAIWLHALVASPWEAAPAGGLFLVALVLLAATFLVVRVLLAWDALRLLLTPGPTKTRRVRRQAFALFRTAAEKRTRASTGVLALSLGRRAPRRADRR